MRQLCDSSAAYLTTKATNNLRPSDTPGSAPGPSSADASRGHPLRRVRRPHSLSYTKGSARSMPSTYTAPPRSFFYVAGYELRAKESSG